MELKLENGRYVSGTGGPVRVSGAEETAQRVMMKLAARRGGFAPLPDYGSRLHALLRTVRPSEYQTAAMECVAEALAEEPEVTVNAVEVSRADGDTLRVDVRFTAGDRAFQTAVAVGREWNDENHGNDL